MWCNFASIFGTHFKLFADISDEIVFMFRMMKIQEPGGLSAASLKWRFSHIVFPIIVGLYGNVLSNLLTRKTERNRDSIRLIEKLEPQ